MNPTEYIENCLRTEPQKYLFEGTNGVSPRMEHAVIGAVTEVGEIMDAIKKAKIYGKPLDVVNLKEEFGDVLWYISLALKDLGLSYEEVFETNIKKLKKRFPEKYTDENALTRDLDAERKILEQ